MKKAILVLLLFIATYINVSADEEQTIKIGLLYGSAAVESVELSFDGKCITANRDDIEDEKSYAAENNEITVNGRRYRGRIILKKNAEGKLNVINEANLEDYVSAVISKEMSPDFEAEALKAQAVCARTYAAANKNKHAKHGFDVCAGVDCQVYFGMDAEHPKTIAAAKDTEGEILIYEGKPALTVYFATSGGHTEDAEFVWGTKIPYLKGVPDPFESEKCYAYRWTRSLSPEKAGQILEENGYELGTIKSITVEKVSDNGSVYALKVVGEKGEKIFTNEACRTLFGYDVLLSQAYTVEKDEGVSVKAYKGSINTSNMYVLSAEGTTRYSGETLYLEGSEKVSVETPQATGDFVFKGRGNGHLVGMSQNGANAMAKAGISYDKILTYYYSGTEIEKPEPSEARSNGELDGI
ncbi:MAG: Amidase enhancer precursor [Firmicutes bacterium ADurb.Bin193]|nr:MAG: Amidase enhancer precursor [Firmicutes bacterium ADurb.Bin193]